MKRAMRISRPQHDPLPISLRWDGADYKRTENGKRLVRVTGIREPEWVRRYSRWSVILECHTLDEDGQVCAFFNLGNDPNGPRIGRGRQSRYFKAWVMANSGELPKKGQSMDPDIFLDKNFWAIIEDSWTDSDGNRKKEAEVYSKIVDFVDLA